MKSTTVAPITLFTIGSYQRKHCRA